MLVYLAVIGDYLANPFRRFYSFVTHTAPKNPKPVLKCTVPNCNKATLVYKETITIPVWLAALLLVMYITGGAFIFNVIEKWTLLDSWYFCFLSLVTIGFGNFTPGRMESISMIATSAYILIGMTLLSMCFNLIQTDMITFFRNLYIWSEREDSFALPPTRIGSWHENFFGPKAEVSTIHGTKRALNRDDKMYNSLPRSFAKTPEGTFQRLVPARKSLESAAHERTYFLKHEINLNDIPPLPESILNRNKTGKRKSPDAKFSSTRITIEDAFIWYITIGVGVYMIHHHEGILTVWYVYTLCYFI